MVREGRHGHALLYAEFDAPATNPPRLATEFRLRRDRVSLRPDPAAALPLTDAHRRIFAAELAPDVPYMTVDDTIRRLADEACGGETNVVRQARAIYDRVVDSADHYSRGENAPKPSPDGSAAYCIEAGGGSCTDMHALFIAMCRARGIPTRLHFGSRVPADREGKDVDTGYRCWAEFFAPGIGWVPVDVAAGDTVANGRDFYFGGLDERRIRFMEGRDLLLDPAPAGPRPNLVIRAHVEIDGVPHTGIRRTIHYRTVR